MMTSFLIGFEKKAFGSIDPSTLGTIGSLGVGYTAGRGAAGNVAGILSRKGYKTRNEETARNVAHATSILGALAGLGLAIKKKDKLVNILRRGFGAHPDMEQLYHGLVPFAGGVGGGIAAGGITGAGMALRGAFHKNKKEV
jgi:hypothetical protein